MLPSNHTTFSLSGLSRTHLGEKFHSSTFSQIQHLIFILILSSLLFCFLFHWESRRSQKRTSMSSYCHAYPPICVCVCTLLLSRYYEWTCPYSYHRPTLPPHLIPCHLLKFLLQQFSSLSHIINFSLCSRIFPLIYVYAIISSILIKIILNSHFTLLPFVYHTISFLLIIAKCPQKSCLHFMSSISLFLFVCIHFLSYLPSARALSLSSSQFLSLSLTSLPHCFTLFLIFSNQAFILLSCPHTPSHYSCQVPVTSTFLNPSGQFPALILLNLWTAFITILSSFNFFHWFSRMQYSSGFPKYPVLLSLLFCFHFISPVSKH